MRGRQTLFLAPGMALVMTPTAERQKETEMANPVFKDGRAYWETSFGFYPRWCSPMGIRLPNGQLLDAMTGAISGERTEATKGK